jgi:hypothetical protein
MYFLLPRSIDPNAGRVVPGRYGIGDVEIPLIWNPAPR